MIKYTQASVVFAEIPNHITLAINIAACKRQCVGCHSMYLRRDLGQDLEEALPTLLSWYKGMVDTVCFMGEGADHDALARCIRRARESGYMTALYSGADDRADIPVLQLLSEGELDFLKIGSYQRALGPLTARSTNQRLYQYDGGKVIDLTPLFWKEYRV